MATRLAPVAAILALVATGCVGKISDLPGDEDPLAAYMSRFPRLSHVQWENTVQDLLYLTEATGLSGSFSADPPLGRFDNNLARLRMTSGLWQDYQRAAEIVAEQVTSDLSAMERILPADLPGDSSLRTRAFIEHFGPRALRRPLSAAEVERYVALSADAEQHYPDDLDPFVASVRLIVEAMLQSPNFLYRTELSAEASGGEIKLSGYEMASRLSYAFWNTMPDSALMAAAASGSLDTEDGVRAEALRMLDDPRTRDSFAHFHEQVFELHEYTDVDKSPELFPEWRQDLATMMLKEVELFLEGVFDHDGTIGDILTSSRTYVNADLAALYGLEGEFDDGFVAAELDSRTRAGILTRLGFLTKNATLTESDPIHRGVFVNLNVLCRPLAAVPNLPDNLMPVGLTNRERINSITGPGTCGEVCHGSIINPVGFSLEHYDAIGRYRTEDNGQPVDAADRYVFLDGRSITFEDGVDFSWQLAAEPDPHACYVSNLLEYLYGGDHGTSDPVFLRELVKLSLEEDASIRELVLGIVSSRSFRYRPAHY